MDVADQAEWDYPEVKPLEERIGFYRRPKERNWHIRTRNKDERRFDSLCGQSMHLDSGISPVIHFRSNDEPPSAGHVCTHCRRELKKLGF